MTLINHVIFYFSSDILNDNRIFRFECNKWVQKCIYLKSYIGFREISVIEELNFKYFWKAFTNAIHRVDIISVTFFIVVTLTNHGTRLEKSQLETTQRHPQLLHHHLPKCKFQVGSFNSKDIQNQFIKTWIFERRRFEAYETNFS